MQYNTPNITKSYANTNNLNYKNKHTHKQTKYKLKS